MPQELPLTDVRVVSLAVNLPGPIAAARLHELGAEVIKIEPPAGDPLASVSPSWYESLVSGQTVIHLDLKNPEQRAVFESELSLSDVLLTAMRPSAAERLGLGDIERRLAALSIVEIIGHEGELAEMPGHDLTYQAAHGTLTPPIMPQVPIADLLGAERAVSAALLALMNRERTGRGERHRVVLEHAAAAAGAAVRHGLMGQGAPLGGGDPAYGIYETADGSVAVAAIEPHFRTRLADMTGASTRVEFERVFRSRPTCDWLAIAQKADIPLTEVSHQPRGVVNEHA